MRSPIPTLLVCAATLAMLTWTWGTWPDPIVDFGHELYLAWRLSEGEVLYRDIAAYNGPFSQYFNALCFKALGASIRTLLACNVVILVGLLALLSHLLRQIATPRATLAALLAFVLLFAFAQQIRIGTYNYLAPYAHEMTHGLVLSLLALAALWRSERGAPAAAFLLGLAFLTKAEIFLAAAGASLVFFRRFSALSLALFALPIAAALALLAWAMPFQAALEGTLGSWAMLADSQVRKLLFFQWGMGLDQPGDNLLAIARASGVYLAALGPALLLAMAWKRKGAEAVAAGVFVLVGGALWLLRSRILWGDLALPLPLLVLLAAPGARGARLSLVAFAFLLMSKMFLNVRLTHYGFVLAMPAVLVAVMAGLDWLPRALERRGGSGAIFAAASLGFLAAFTAANLEIQSQWLAAKVHPVGEGANRFFADSRGAYVDEAARQIAETSPKDSTLVALPHGAMLNFLARRRDPTPYLNLLPPEVVHYGEAAIVRAFVEKPPSIIALVQTDSSEFGHRFFGRDYARRLGGWVEENYQPFRLIGAPPLRDGRFGILLMRKR
jgi:hypothetical protein